MAETAEADDTDLFAGAGVPVLQGAVGGDAGAEQGSGTCGVEVGGNLQGEGLVEGDVLAVAAEGEIALFVLGVIGEDGGVALAVLLFAVGAGGALAAAIDHAADGGEVADLELLDFGADLGDAADDLVAGNHGVERIAPFIAGLVNVGVTDATEIDVDHNVLRTGIPVLVLEGRGGVGGGLDGVTVRGNHADSWDFRGG